MKKLIFIVPMLLLCSCFYKFKGSHMDGNVAFRNSNAKITYTKEASECINYNLFSLFARMFYINDNFTISDIAKKGDITEVVDVIENNTHTLYNSQRCITVRGN